MRQLEEELPPDEADRLTRAYSMLGLVPESLDLRSLLVDVYQEQVAGFYDPDSLTLWIMNDQPDATIQTVLLHELVHAVQGPGDFARCADSKRARVGSAHRGTGRRSKGTQHS